MPKKSTFIDWKKIKHVTCTNEGDNVIIKTSPTDVPLSRVNIITVVSKENIAFLPVSFYSWNNLTYPESLLKWFIFDPKGLIGDEEKKLLLKDKNIVINTKKLGSFDKYVLKVIKDVTKNNTEDVTGDVKKDVTENVNEDAKTEDLRKDPDREDVFMITNLGDIIFADSLVTKHRIMAEYNVDCIIPDTLAYYDHLQNTNYLYRVFLDFPRSGIYWRNNWWTSKNQKKIISIPYIGNCIGIGSCPIYSGMIFNSSFRFFDNFPKPVKEIIKKVKFEPVDNED